MQFRFIRLIDQSLGRIALYILAPLSVLISYFLKPKPQGERKIVSFLKLHGGGSLLVAMPALLGIRKKYPAARFDLICTEETKKYAELTGVFDRFIVIEPRSLFTLVISGIEALAHCFRNDACVDLEPHSFLAAVFCLMTFAPRRIGLVKPHEYYRALAYTDALYFNPSGPIYVFYDQIARSLAAEPAPIPECQEILRAQIQNIEPMTGLETRPAVLIGAFASRHGTERMMPPEVWADQLRRAWLETPVTLVLSGSKSDRALADRMENILRTALPKAIVINKCGERTLAQTARDIQAMDAFCGIDSGLLHLARLLSKHCKSYWGPTDPRHRLQTVPELKEDTVYLGFACSPCIHVAPYAPCKGDNQCLKSLMSQEPIQTPPIYIRRHRA